MGSRAVARVLAYEDKILRVLFVVNQLSEFQTAVTSALNDAVVASPLTPWTEIEDVQEIYTDELEEVIATLSPFILRHVRPLDVIVFKHW